MKKEILMAVYINVGNMPPADVECFMKKALKEVHKNDDELKTISIHYYLVPVRGNQESKIECIYPKYTIIADEQAKEAEEINKLLLSLTDKAVVEVK